MVSKGTDTRTPPVMEIAEKATPEAKVEASLAVQSEGPIEVSEVLRDRMDETLLLVQRLLAAAGKSVRFALPEAEDDAATELSPERLGFMTTLKARYEKNEHGIACHSGTEWSKVEAKLRANPSKLDTLKKMEDLGGAPDVYKVEGEDFIFGDLSSIAPEGRRRGDYYQAVVRAFQMGEDCKLMHPNDYLMIGNDLGIAMDQYPERAWLDSAHRSDLLENGDALCGDQRGGCARVYRRYVYARNPGGGFRCSLRV